MKVFLAALLLLIIGFLVYRDRVIIAEEHKAIADLTTQLAATKEDALGERASRIDLPIGQAFLYWMTLQGLNLAAVAQV